ncbi:tetratricopeptide repeat protein [Candidatus Peregrinibacteria bacterium]|nr:tetratricopeptide repeat protein [Candidatus Peregrinibacteria bacterium]
MEILLALIILSLIGIFVRRYYINEKGVYLERALLRAFNGGARIHAKHRRDKQEKPSKERKAPSHVPKSVPKTMEAKMLYSKAMIFYERGELKQAEKKLIQVTSLDQHFHDALHRLGLIYLKQAQFSKAEALFRQLTTQRDDHAVYHSNLGRALYEQEKFEEALSSYLRSIELDDSRPGRFISTAEVYRKLGNPKKAHDMYETALKLDPTNLDYLLIFAHFLIDQKHYKEALEYLQKALDKKPDNQVALEMKKECEKAME